MDTETGKISKCQEIYIKHLKESHLKNHADIRVLYPADPPYTNGVSQPKVDDYYRKPCMVFAPHIQFPEVFAYWKELFISVEEGGRRAVQNGQQHILNFCFGQKPIFYFLKIQLLSTIALSNN